MSRRSLVWLIVIAAFAVILVRSKTIQISRFQVIYLCVLIPSIILHEISHGAVANAFGDDTAKRAGRLTLNPIPHIDPVGSLILPAVLALSHSPAAFGWAKPVPVNVSRLRHPRNQSVLVSLAGPATNALLFAACALVFRYLLAHRLFLSTTQSTMPLGYEVLFTAALANMTLCFFNLLPIPPLDGSAVVERVLPERHLHRYFQLRPYGMAIVLVVALLVFRNPSVQGHLFGGEIRLWNAVAGTAF